MKKQVYPFFILFVSIAFLACSSTKNTSKVAVISPLDRVQGSWRLIANNGVDQGRNQYKHYTETNFFWHIMNNANIIVSSGGGECYADGDYIVEKVTFVSPNMSEIKGMTAKIKIELKQDTLIQRTTLGAQTLSETWVKIKKDR